MKALCRKNYVNSREKDVTPSSDNTQKLKRRTEDDRAESTDTRCHMNIQLSINTGNGYWYLYENSNLNHRYHTPDAVDIMLLNKEDLDQSQPDMISVMYNHSIPNSSTTEVMTNLVNKRNTEGEFLPSTIGNITKEMEDAMDVVSGIDFNFSIAKKTTK